MRATVVLTRTLGVRRKPDEIKADPGIAGELTLEEREGRSNHFGRALRIAHLCTPRGVGSRMVDALVPLADPTLVRVTADSLVLVGFETDFDAQRDHHAEHAQGWLIRLG